MKLFLLIILFACFVCLASFVYLFYILRKNLYKDLGYICKYLKNNISFNKNNINTLLTNCFKDISRNSRYLIENNSKQVSTLVAGKNNKTLLRDFFKSLGKGDVDYEINNLNYYETNFENNLKSSTEELKTKGQVYFKLIIGLGLIVCILLI